MGLSTLSSNIQDLKYLITQKYKGDMIALIDYHWHTLLKNYKECYPYSIKNQTLYIKTNNNSIKFYISNETHTIINKINSLLSKTLIKKIILV